MNTYAKIQTIPVLAFMLALAFVLVLLRLFGIDHVGPAVLGASGFFPFIGMASDAELIIRDGGSAGNLTATETSPSTHEGPFRDLLYQLTLPAVADVLNTITVALQESSDNVTFTQCGIWSAAEIGTVAVLKKKPFTSIQPYHRWVITVATGGGAAVNYGAADLRAISGGEYTNASRAL